MRHALLAAAFGVMLLLPIISALAPPVRVLLPARTQAPTLKAPLAKNATLAAATVSKPAKFSTVDLLFTVWIAGTALFLVPMATGLWQLGALRRTGQPWRDAHRNVEVFLHSSLTGPITYGLFRPAIILPADAQTWSEDDLNRALVHELEHIRRGDWLTHCAARAICALYWFHPLVWMAWQRLELEAERACDDAVLGQSEATAYADQLVALAQRLSSASKSTQLAMANRADLSARVSAVLDSGQTRGRAGTAAVALASIGAVLLVATISPLKVVAAPQDTIGVFRASDQLVIADVVVKDDSGNAIENLKAGDFAVTEDGIPQKVRVFEFQNVSPGPLSSYYVLGYYAARNMDGKFRRIQIALTNNLVARLDYRTGYYGNPSKTPIDAGPPAGAAFDPATRPPALLYKVDPEYSEEARKAKYSGIVILSVLVDTSGRAQDIKVIKALGLGLDEKAMEAVSKWRFRPATKNGQPITVTTQAQVDFRLL